MTIGVHSQPHRAIRLGRVVSLRMANTPSPKPDRAWGILPDSALYHIILLFQD